MAKQHAELQLGDDGKWTAETADGFLLTDNDLQRWWPTMIQALDELSGEGWELVATLDRREDRGEQYAATFLLARERPPEESIT